MKNTWVLNRMEMLFNLYCYGYKAYTMQCSLKVYITVDTNVCGMTAAKEGKVDDCCCP
jgi:hypothetical protein